MPVDLGRQESRAVGMDVHGKPELIHIMLLNAGGLGLQVTSQTPEGDVQEGRGGMAPGGLQL